MASGTRPPRNPRAAPATPARLRSAPLRRPAQPGPGCSRRGSKRATRSPALKWGFAAPRPHPGQPIRSARPNPRPHLHAVTSASPASRRVSARPGSGLPEPLTRPGDARPRPAPGQGFLEIVFSTTPCLPPVGRSPLSRSLRQAAPGRIFCFQGFGGTKPQVTTNDRAMRRGRVIMPA